jgi:CHAD domain-containing protein
VQGRCRAGHTGGVHSFVERELKFDVEPGFTVPDLLDTLPPGSKVETVSHQLRSDYFDTVDRDLLLAGMTLRRRTGSTDTGWQLKVPHPPFREEIRADLDGDPGDGPVPADLHRLLLGVSRDQPLRHIASIITERSVTHLLDADGRRLAEIDDDSVHASVAGHSATVANWREVEVELGEADLELLDALDRRLRRAGARRSTSTSKLARALPPPRLEAKQTLITGGRPAKNSKHTRHSALPAGDVVTAYIAEQQRVMVAGDLALRRGEDTVIHKTRVATRRLRSTLRVFAELFDTDRAAQLDGELRWYAAVLGEVRDRQVLQKRLDTMIAAVDDALLLGPVRTRVDSELRRELIDRWRLLQDVLTEDRYLSLLADVANWTRQPPLTQQADAPARVLTKLIRRADRKVSRKLQRANSTGDVHLLHGARKSAKRARYAAEAAEPVIGARASIKEAKRYQRLQDLLGEHQDSLVSAEFLRRLGAIAGTTEGENGFAFGILHEREIHNARVARAKARKTAKRYT